MTYDPNINISSSPFKIEMSLDSINVNYSHTPLRCLHLCLCELHDSGELGNHVK